MTTPQISVVMSCFNASRWLALAVDSVLAQTFEDFELIAVDDGSTDETWKIIQNYCKRDRRVVAISKTNTGLSDSLNVGIAAAKGNWVARLDADDLCEGSRLEQQLKYVQKNPELILVGTGCFEIDENGAQLKAHLYPSGNSALFRHLLRLRRFFPHSSAFYRREAVSRIGGYRTRLRVAQDWDLWLRLSEYGQLGCVESPLVRIRKHDAQISHDESGRRQIVESRAAVISYLLRRRGLTDPLTANESEWRAFEGWVETRMQETGEFDIAGTHSRARSIYFGVDDRLVGAAAAARSLVSSGRGLSLLRRKLFGSRLPERLVNEWLALSLTLPASTRLRRAEVHE